jgi:hypothetical protein
MKARHLETHLLRGLADPGKRPAVGGYEVGHHREPDETDRRPGDRLREGPVSPRHHRSANLTSGRIERKPHGALETAEQVVVLRSVREPRIRTRTRAEKGVAGPA